MKRKRMTAAAMCVAVVLGSGVMVWQASGAAFTATTDNPVNNWSAGTVALTDDDNGVAKFTATNMKPGSGNYECIRVTYTGTIDADVRMYITGASGGLAPYLEFHAWIHPEGEGCSQGPANSYDVPFPTAVADRTDWATGLHNRRMSPGDSYSFGLSNNLPPGAPNSAQGQSATANFVWEARSIS